MPLHKKYDAFLSYAIEDRETVARPVYDSLTEKGLNIYFAGNELEVGDAIAEVISYGLRKSRCGIVILSPHYNRQWTLVELYSLFEQEQRQKKSCILPVWHDLNYAEAIRQYPILADRYALLTTDGIESVAERLSGKIREYKKTSARKFAIRIALVISVLAIMTAAGIAAFTSAIPPRIPPKELLQAEIKKRIAAVQSDIDLKLQELFSSGTKISIVPDSINSAYNLFNTLSDHERNDFHFFNGSGTISGRKNLHDTGINISRAPYEKYGLAAVSCYQVEYKKQFTPDTVFTFRFAMLNAEPVTYHIDTFWLENDKTIAVVSHAQNIRAVSGSFQYLDAVKKQYLLYLGVRPREEYIFGIRHRTWTLEMVR
jgi:hypothetical protein